ncbi:MAG: alpha/beta hydrolase [Gammaproteobacteria bacterium]
MVSLKTWRALFFLLLPSLAGCTGLFFHPMQQHVRTPDQIGLNYRDVSFTSHDNMPLHGWWLPAQGTARGTVVFFHGNAENISTHIGAVHWLPKEGFNVFLPDYRGYGASRGTPEIKGLHADAESALDAVAEMPEARDTPLIVLGQSLGGAVATYTVAHSRHRSRIKALIVESAFSSYRDITREKLAGFWMTWPLQYPLSWTINDDYSPVNTVARVTPIPILLVYGDRDRIVPLSHGQRLYNVAADPKTLWVVPGSGHIEAFKGKEYRRALIDYLDSLLSGKR